jgi:hypothetical protein
MIDRCESWTRELGKHSSHHNIQSCRTASGRSPFGFFHGTFGGLLFFFGPVAIAFLAAAEEPRLTGAGLVPSKSNAGDKLLPRRRS